VRSLYNATWAISTMTYFSDRTIINEAPISITWLLYKNYRPPPCNTTHLFSSENVNKNECTQLYSSILIWKCCLKMSVLSCTHLPSSTNGKLNEYTQLYSSILIWKCCLKMSVLSCTHLSSSVNCKLNEYTQLYSSILIWKC